MDRITIESAPLHNLSVQLLNSSHLYPKFKEDDKGLSWDGHIEVYSREKGKKSDFVGKCEVQIKGHEVFDISEMRKKKIQFGVNLEDLRIYQNNGGVLYFVVYIARLQNGQISCAAFYNSLLPFKISKILKHTKYKQKNKTVEFYKFPKECKEMERVINFFIRHSRLQSGKFYNNDNSDTFINKVGFYDTVSILDNPKDTILSFNNEPIYLYKKIEDSVTFIPIEMGFVTNAIINDLPIKVSIDGKIYFVKAHLKFKRKEKNISVILNRGLSISNIGNKKEGKVKFNNNCTIDEYIDNLQFIFALSKGKELQIENIATGINFSLDKKSADIENAINYHTKIQTLFQTLHIDKEVLLSSFQHSDFDKLIFLYETIVEQKETTYVEDSIRNKSIIKAKMKIGKLQILMLISKVDDGKFIYEDFFNIKKHHFWVSTVKDRKNKYPCSACVMVSKEDILNSDNVYYEGIVQSITNVPYSQCYGDDVTNLIVEMLAAYDEQKNEKLLDSTISIAKWLYECDSKNLYYSLNMLQAVKRKRLLNDNEINQLIEYRKNEEDPFNLAAISAILGDKLGYEHYLKALSDEQKEAFLMYPINSII